MADTPLDSLDVTLPAGGFAVEAAARAVREGGLPELLARVAAGPFGQSATGVRVLETIADAVDVGLAAASGLEGLVLASSRPAGSFEVVTLAPAQARLVAAFQAVVTAREASRRLAEIAPPPTVEGALELDGLDALLAAGHPPPQLAERLVKLATRWVELRGRLDAEPSPRKVAHGACSALIAFMTLFERAVVLLGETGALRPMVESLAARPVTVGGRPWCGLEARETAEDTSGLLPVWPEGIVGNDEYLAAGLRLARAVAAYDLERGRNPRRLNPVLFGLGKPGCGKTVTAHAIGNYFLRYCRERGVPARFVVVRRTDWASSYQNASALNLVRIFREEVHGFDGVAGVYWPDIDTAFASRSSTGLRMEEKQNLGAVFGVFDGTLLPRDGKWFLICDANTLNMDEATVSRIAQNPFTVTGPTTGADYEHLMRDLMLGDVAEFLVLSPAQWAAIGARAAELGVPGRGVDAICGNVRAEIQDFELPETYFQAPGETRDAMVRALHKPIDAAALLARLEAWVSFQQDAEERATRERFERDVDEMVRRLNAGQAAARRAVIDATGDVERG